MLYMTGESLKWQIYSLQWAEFENKKARWTWNLSKIFLKKKVESLTCAHKFCVF